MNGVKDDTFCVMKHLSTIETMKQWTLQPKTGSLSGHFHFNKMINLWVLEETECWYSVSQKTIKEPQYLFTSSVVVTYGPFIVEFSHASRMQVVEAACFLDTDFTQPSLDISSLDAPHFLVM